MCIKAEMESVARSVQEDRSLAGGDGGVQDGQAQIEQPQLFALVASKSDCEQTLRRTLSINESNDVNDEIDLDLSKLWVQAEQDASVLDGCTSQSLDDDSLLKSMDGAAAMQNVQCSSDDVMQVDNDDEVRVV